MSNPRNQHLVPQFYLNHFARKGMLTTFSISSKTVFASSVQNSGFERDYYNIPPEFLRYYFEIYEQRVDEKFIETFLSKYHESIVAPYLVSLSKVEGKVAEGNVNVVSIKQRLLEQFFIIQFFRTWRFGVEFKSTAQLIRAEFNRKSIYPKIFNLAKLENNIHAIFLMYVLTGLGLGEGVRAKLDFSGHFLGLTTIAERLYTAISGSNKLILVSTSEREFVTSDNPAFVKWTNDQESPNFEFGYLPLTRKMAVVFTHQDPRFPSNQILLIDAVDELERIKNLNCLLATKTSRFIYASNDTPVTYLRDYVEGKFPVNLRL